MGMLMHRDFPYDMRSDAQGMWEVYNIFTGQVAVINTRPMQRLDAEDACETVNLLNEQHAVLALFDEALKCGMAGVKTAKGHAV